ncbi:hypothetical protein P171DRAFT_429519 [Karstenula rhodostoma CBS 690.94]|uniref:Uncharacterized protein n=1 Tax=Karstenula rhodostoma CBS 690.94 TaxID=1392251 RepID=A0A9P4PMN3_9PLEO|nr:hypothetical protein P171DRAFT_429519 [Karstenula rhodostoma CBS 690.94]
MPKNIGIYKDPSAAGITAQNSTPGDKTVPHVSQACCARPSYSQIRIVCHDCGLVPR